MNESIDDVLKERGKKYGVFSEHARITQQLKSVMKGTDKWTQLTLSQREALEMVAHKIGRILNGDPNYVDSWFDIEGYVKLVRDELTANEAQLDRTINFGKGIELTARQQRKK